ncbi:hypothetical protein BDW22DRAFT_1465490 [Trametopsis cervina]|nr:hypothetical protein BDW22DRAFT_1465490 [Trametopsis cervina]
MPHRKAGQRKARSTTASQAHITRATAARLASGSKKHRRTRSTSSSDTNEPPHKQVHASVDTSNMEDDGADNSASATSYASEDDAQESDDSLVEATPSQKNNEQRQSKAARKLAFETPRFTSTITATQPTTVLPTTHVHLITRPASTPPVAPPPLINARLSSDQDEQQAPLPQEQSAPGQEGSTPSDTIDFVPARSRRGHANLNDQPIRLRTVLANSLPAVFRTFCLHKCFEGAKVYNNWVRTILINTAAAEKYEDIQQRLIEDNQYAKDIAQIMTKVYYVVVDKIRLA